MLSVGYVSEISRRDSRYGCFGLETLSFVGVSVRRLENKTKALGNRTNKGPLARVEKYELIVFPHTYTDSSPFQAFRAHSNKKKRIIFSDCFSVRARG